MIETQIIPTYFEHSEIRTAGIEPTEPYTLFEPLVLDGDKELNRQDSLSQMIEFAEAIGSRPPYTIPLGGGDKHTIGSFLDTDGEDFLAEINTVAPVPVSLQGILKTVAEVAELSGFDRDKASFSASFLNPEGDTNVNLHLHSDGLSGTVEEDTTSAKVTRFVYALGTGTVFYPDLPTDKNDAKIIQQELEGVGLYSPTEVNPIRAINAARNIKITEQEAVDGSAQQVMPGVILGFDPTRTFWHQAPNETRPVLVIDIAQTE